MSDIFPQPIPRMTPAEYAMAKEGLCPKCRVPTQSIIMGDGTGSVTIHSEQCDSCGMTWVTTERESRDEKA